MMSSALVLATEQATEALLAAGWRVATAESCTGGLIAQQLTERPGSSKWFDRGWVTYSNAAKQDMLGVPVEVLETEGAVSARTACSMAQGALRYADAHVAAAVTGIAGPSGGSPHKPVGLVWLAFVTHQQSAYALQCHFRGTRAAVREQTAVAVLQEITRLARAASAGPYA